jgi:hypothetical protein
MVVDIALLSWIIIGTMLFAFTTPTRAFLLCYIIGLLVLPVEIDGGRLGAIYITNSIRLDRITACHLATLLGTIIFCPERFSRFRFSYIDALFGLLLAGVFATDLNSGMGLHAGISNAANMVRTFGGMIFFARIYITNFDELYETLRALIGGAVVYSAVSVFEFRFSPQLHNMVYGYFQHSFNQFVRYGHFRPVGAMRHAIEFSFFMGTSCLLAVGLVAKKMFPPLWGILPGWAVVGITLIGLACTLTFTGYSAFIVGALLLAVLFTRPRRGWLLVLPLVAVSFMGLRTAGLLPAAPLVNSVAQVSTARAASLDYRLQSGELNLKKMRAHALLGLGYVKSLAKGRGGGLAQAVDAYWLITAANFGFPALAAWLAIWTAGIAATIGVWRIASPEERWICCLIGVTLGLVLVDYLANSFPSYFILMIDLGLLSVWQHRAELAARMPAPIDEPVMQDQEMELGALRPVVH